MWFVFGDIMIDTSKYSGFVRQYDPDEEIWYLYGVDTFSDKQFIRLKATCNVNEMDGLFESLITFVESL